MASLKEIFNHQDHCCNVMEWNVKKIDAMSCSYTTLYSLRTY